MKLDLKTETEKLVQRMDRENQKLNKQLTEKLHSEIRMVLHKVRQVQGEVEIELVAAKRSIDTVQGDLERKLAQQTSYCNVAMEELVMRIVDTKTEVDSKVDSNI
jgi:thymidylate kinase